MLTVVIISWVLKRPSDVLNSLFAAALIILTWQPQQLFQAGFQLSFFVVLCIILTVPALHKSIQHLTEPEPLRPAGLRKRWPPVISTPMRYLGGVALASFAAWVGALPLVAYYFNLITPVSTPANLVAVPLCGLVLMSDLASLLVGGWFPAAAELFNNAGWFVMECIRVTSHWFATWPLGYFYVPAPTLFTTALYYLLLLGILTGWMLHSRLRFWRITFLALLVAFWGWQWQREWSAIRLSILPLNGGSALYFNGPGMKNDLLVDCGTTNAVQFITKPFLRAQGVNRLPSLLLTHGDLRHIGGAELVSDLFSARQVYISPIRFRSPTYRQVVKDFGRQPERLRTISRDDQAGSWVVLHPQPTDRFPQADDNALVLSGTFHGTRILLLSDLGRPGQNALLERTNDLRADIVVAGLPSASEALGDALLDAIQPSVVIVSDSEFPATARASAKLRERLAQRHFLVIYTRSAGATTIEFCRNKWELRTMSGIQINGRSSGNLRS